MQTARAVVELASIASAREPRREIKRSFSAIVFLSNISTRSHKLSLPLLRDECAIMPEYILQNLLVVRRQGRHGDILAVPEKIGNENEDEDVSASMST
jgi:hypothetical protein